jgi:thioredoxin 2
MNAGNDIVIRCLRCGQKNRIPGHAVLFKPICGRCGAKLDELIIRCLHCGTRNLVSEDRVHERPRCGRCGEPLYQGTVLDIRDDSFESEILNFPGPALVCLWTPGCTVCGAVLPLFEKIAPVYGGGVKMAKMAVGDCPGTAAKYGVTGTPAFLLFRNGRLEGILEGTISREDLEKRVLQMIRERSPR